MTKEKKIRFLLLHCVPFQNKSLVVIKWIHGLSSNYNQLLVCVGIWEGFSAVTSDYVKMDWLAAGDIR